MTQPKEKKIVTRKLSNKVSQLLTDFLCTDKLTYWMLKDVDRDRVKTKRNHDEIFQF